MQEIVMCPACGAKMRLSEYDVWQCGTCAFSCRTCDLPRISAAMELAKMTALNCTSFDPTLVDEDALLAQIAKTVDVFK